MLYQKIDEISSNVFLMGTLVTANLDFPSLADYAIKAAIGGLIWMAFKVGADFVSDKIKNRKNKTKSNDD